MPSSDKSVAVTLKRFRTVVAKFNGAVSSKKRPSQNILSQLWEAVHLVLRAYNRPGNFSPLGTPKEHFPPEVADFLANQVEYIRSGKLPDPMKDMLRPGSPGTGPQEDRDIGVAVAYIQAARNGLIEDKHPVTTIHDSYGVAQRTVRSWQQKRSWVKPTDFFPNIEGIELGKKLIQEVKNSGLRYQQGGRGAQGRVTYPRPNKA